MYPVIIRIPYINRHITNTNSKTNTNKSNTKNNNNDIVLMIATRCAGTTGERANGGAQNSDLQEPPTDVEPLGTTPGKLWEPLGSSRNHPALVRLAAREAITRQHPWIPYGGSSVKTGTMQRILAWPLREDDAHKSRSVNNLLLSLEVLLLCMSNSFSQQQLSHILRIIVVCVLLLRYYY